MAYHHIANGLVESFHHQLNGALKEQPDVTSWANHLPMVLLGIHTALKEDLHCTAAELVFGTTLYLPADLLDSSCCNDLDPLSYVARLKATM